MIFVAVMERIIFSYDRSGVHWASTFRKFISKAVLFIIPDLEAFFPDNRKIFKKTAEMVRHSKFCVDVSKKTVILKKLSIFYIDYFFSWLYN